MPAATPLRSLLVIGLIGLSHLCAQTRYTVRHFGTDEGLSNEWISDVSRDAEGYLWVATQYGVNRYDGQQFRVFTYHPTAGYGPPANWTKRVLPAGPGSIIMGSLGRGVYRIDPYTEHFDSLPGSPPYADDTVVDDLLLDGRGRTWVASSGGTFVVSAGQTTYREFAVGRIQCLAQLSDSLVVGGGQEGVFLLDPLTGRHRQLIGGGGVEAIRALNRDSLLVVRNDALELWVLRDGEWHRQQRFFSLNVEKSSFYLPFFSSGDDGLVWLTAGERVWEIDPAAGEANAYAPTDLLGDEYPGVKVHRIYHDREGTTWWATNAGLFQLRPTRPFFRPLAEYADLPTEIREVVEVGRFTWLATPAGLYRWNRAGGERPRRVDRTHYRALCAAKEGYLYAYGRRDGRPRFHRFDLTTGEKDATFVPPVADLPNGGTWSMVEDRAGRLWIAAWNQLLCYDPRRDDFAVHDLRKNDQEGSFGILELHLDDRDRLWIGTLQRGILRLDSTSDRRLRQGLRFTRFRHDAGRAGSLSTNLVMQIHQTCEGDIWVATDGGLHHYREATNDFRRYLRGGDLPDDKILSLTSDARGHLWMGSISHGIIRLDPTRDRFTVYDRRDGLAGNAMLLSSHFRTNDGHLYLGGQDGLYRFHPDDFVKQDQAPPPPLVWQSLRLYGRDTTEEIRFPIQRTAFADGVTIRASVHTVKYEFRALSFRNAGATEYQFRLQGLHDGWLPPTSTGNLTLRKLPPGAYTLEIRATNREEGWSVMHPSVTMRVVPPWYASAPAWVVYGMLVAGLGYAFYRFRLRQRLAEAREEQVRKATEEKLAWFHRIAHEFRTPLAVIDGAVDQLAQNPVPEPTRHLEEIRRQSGHLAGQVDQILELARLRAGIPRAAEETDDFTAFQRDVCAAFRVLAAQKDITLRVDLPREPLYFPFAPDEWRKITGNLLANAIKFTPAGGLVTVVLRTEPGPDHLTTVRLSVADSGPGVAPHFRDQLFTPFTRDNAQVSGTGLGLHLARALLRRRGGELRLAEPTGGGSVFVASLPVRLPAVPKEVEAMHNEGQHPLILVAEDHPALCDYLVFCLGDRYRVHTVADGAAALAFATENVPDLIVSDIGMPKLNGIDLLRALNRQSATDHIPVILLTAHGATDSRVAGRRAGAEAFLTKPCPRPELLAAVRSILDKRARLWAKFGRQEAAASPAAAPLPDFLRRAREVVHRRMTDEDFGVAELAATLHLSRTQLFRKIKALSGLSPTMFVRRMRLEAAHKQLLTGAETVAEVAYAHGFRDPSYFAKVYRGAYGRAPSETVGRGGVNRSIPG